ncbi:MAG: hypothetical protein QOJ07_1478, partial [Thermoleophilaceae bacterium]|nr:hypothetical protein [Thermoleophilaceae bacterium]
MARRAAAAALAATALAALTATPAVAQLPGLPDSCATTPDATKLPDAAQLRSWNRIIDHGVRPTGSAAQVRYIDWIR